MDNEWDDWDEGDFDGAFDEEEELARQAHDADLAIQGIQDAFAYDCKACPKCHGEAVGALSETTAYCDYCGWEGAIDDLIVCQDCLSGDNLGENCEVYQKYNG